MVSYIVVKGSLIKAESCTVTLSFNPKTATSTNR